MLDDLNLRVAAVAFQTHRGYDTLDGLDRRIAATKQRRLHMGFAAAEPDLSSSRVGRVPPESKGPAWETLVTALGRSGPFRPADRRPPGGPNRQREWRGSGPAAGRAAAASDGRRFRSGRPADGGLLAHRSHRAAGARRRAVAGPRRRPRLSLAAKALKFRWAGARSTSWPSWGRLEEFSFRGYIVVARGQAAGDPAEISAAVQYLKNL